MIIPFYGVKKYYANHQQLMLSIVDDVYSSGNHFGKETEDLEAELCRFTGRKFAVGLNSCTDAIYLALKSAGIGRGDEVLVTSFSFIASASPILRVGAIPVFVDICPKNFLMDLHQLQMKITSRTRAILAVHLFGQTLDMEALESLAQKNHLIIIEDAAQALGAECRGRKAGSMGLTSCLSFDPTKVISAFGSGGALLTDDEMIVRKVRQLRYHGKTSENDFAYTGYNCRLSGTASALLTFQLKELLNMRIVKLREIADIYSQRLHGFVDIVLPLSDLGHYHIYHKYVIRTIFRDELRNFLKTRGIETMIHYPVPMPDYTLFGEVDNQNIQFPASRQAGKEVFSLPIYPELSTEEIDYICKSILSFNP
ncbi:MAG: DegT/DnrJ/EryC1/StrS family aminotransferase [Bacteroidota bacterium]